MTKFDAPKVMVTPLMLKAGLDFMAKCISEDDEAMQVSDEAVVTGTFLIMWATYWQEIADTHKKKQSGSPIVKPTNLIIPRGLT